MRGAIERFAIARVEPVGGARTSWRAAIATGRVLLSLIFVFGGINKILEWDAMTGVIAGEGLQPAWLFLAGAIALELGGGLSVLTGLYTRIGALLLIAFLVPVTLIMHDFWTYTGGERQMQMVNFMKNLSIMGGVLILLGVGAGAASVDSKLSERG